MENQWLVHVRAYRKEHPSLSYKDTLKGAKNTYTKKPKLEKGAKPHPWMMHLEELKKADPEWKTKMTYKEFLTHAKTTYKKSVRL